MRHSWKGYALAGIVTAATVAVTRLTWPLFAAAPFAPVFGGVALVTQWGGGPAGLLAIALAAAGTALAFPGPGDPFGWTSPTLFIFIAIAFVGNRLIAGRNQALAALRASDAELRATMGHMRESEERLRRAQKMEAIGQLAAGVAHNFNNLLQVTMGYTDILMDARAEGRVDADAIAEIRKATERGGALTRQLLAFVRKHDARAARVDLDVTLAAMQDMLRGVIREDIELTMALDSRGAAVMIDPFDLEQVVFNLAINARDALPDGGAVEIGVARVAVDESNRPRDQTVAPGEYARLHVRDNGTGMSADVQAHLFEPFFTTKEVGEGTGLGLAFVDGVARHGGGFVTADTAPGRGTTIAVYLPIVPASTAAATVPAASPRAPLPQAARPPATVLLVEDEDGVRLMTSRMLTRAGYRVLSAANPGDAIAIFDAHAGEIELLLTDVVMPGMHGPELAARLAARRPELPVVFVSGYSDEMPTLALPSSKTTFVPKPFSAATLISALQGLLAQQER